MSNVYDQLGKGVKSEHDRKIGKNTYKVRTGLIDPDELYLVPVDSTTRTGNPRFFTLHRALLAVDPERGPLTAEEQMSVYKGEFDLPEKAKGLQKFCDKTHRNFKTLKEGLERSGESQDDLIVSWDGGACEGNTRTVAMQALKKEGKGFSKVRILCLPKNVDPADVAALLTRRHVVPPCRWESSNQTEVLEWLVAVQNKMEDGDSIREVSLDFGIQDKKLRTLLDAGRFLADYQKKTGDFRPDKFSIFLKIAGNSKLRNMLYPKKDGTITTDKDADEDGLGVYNEELLPRFYKWTQTDRINGRSDVTNMTSKDVGLLMGKNAKWLSAIDEGGAGDATKKILMAANSGNRKEPGLKPLEQALVEINKIDAIAVEKLTGNKDYVDRLVRLQRKLVEAIERFKPQAPQAPKEDDLLKDHRLVTPIGEVA